MPKKNNLSPRAMLLQGLEMADPLWPDPYKMRTVPTPLPTPVPPPDLENIPMLHETHCIVWLHGMSLVTDDLPRPLRPGAYYDEDASTDFQFIRRSFGRSQSAYLTRVTMHTDTHSDATPKPTFPIIQNNKLMDLVEVMEKRRDMARAMLTTSALIFQEKMDGAETEEEREKQFSIVCFLQDLPKHRDFLRLEIALLPGVKTHS